MSPVQLPAQEPNHSDPRQRQRSVELLILLARCPEHLFSTDEDELHPQHA